LDQLSSWPGLSRPSTSDFVAVEIDGRERAFAKTWMPATSAGMTAERAAQAEWKLF
jgi:hypothetical protein